MQNLIGKNNGNESDSSHDKEHIEHITDSEDENMQKRHHRLLVGVQNWIVFKIKMAIFMMENGKMVNEKAEGLSL